MVKIHVYAHGKRKELNLCRLPFGPLRNNHKLFTFVVNGRYFSIFWMFNGLEERGAKSKFNFAVRVCPKRGSKSI